MIFKLATTPLKFWKKSPPNDAYKRWVRRLPCLTCNSTRRVEAAHTGPRGLGQKSPDESCLPLCEICHRTGRHSYHKLGPVAFGEFWGRVLADDVLFFQWLYGLRYGGASSPARIAEAEVAAVEPEGGKKAA